MKKPLLMKPPISVLVTGCQGFIASHIPEALSEYAEKTKQTFQIRGIDIKDGNDINTAFLPKVDYVFHLAGQAGAMPSLGNPMWDAKANILSAIRIASFYGKFHPLTKIIYTTSAAALDPQSPYGISKKASEDYFRHFAPDTAVICRLSSVFGDKPVGVVDTFIRQQKLTVHGDGSATRDFVHVKDVARGLVQAMKWDAGEYNMGSGKGTTIRQLAEATGKPTVYSEPRKGEIHTSILENTTPDWEPEINVLDYVRDRVHHHNLQKK